MPNRLAASTSPYLQQHADNPVDWFEWGDEAFSAAQARDVPVLLSIGYAACHWCHVMAHESFEDSATAAVMNDHFVNVKVDREERPDVDASMMEAVTALVGHGGWPLTAFLTPTGRLFYAGTYFPDQPRHGMPAFGQVLAAVSAAWQERREEVEAAGRRIAEQLAAQPSPVAVPVGPDELARAVEVLAADYDHVNGGFGGAPKFPPSMVLEWLLRHHARTRDPVPLRLVEGTCRAMARGGMYDQLGGGFARYAVDAAWVVPHFEKMLYDNALLLGAYLHWWRLSGDPLAERVARETAAFLLGDLRTPQGGFASSLDADTVVEQAGGRVGVEGLTYVWTPQQLVDVLGPSDGPWAARLLGVTEHGTFEHGASTLQLRTDPDDPHRWAVVRAQLQSSRQGRPQPARDDKVVAAWNGLAVVALAEAGLLLEEPSWVQAAVSAARLLLEVHVVEGAAGGTRLRRVSRDGVVGAPAGLLEDYAGLAQACLTLLGATGEDGWLAPATELLDVVLEQFVDADGAFHDTAADATDPRLHRRPADPSDNATPSGRAAAAGALLTLAGLTGERRYREAAERALASVGALSTRAPRFLGWSLAVAEAAVHGPVEVAVAGRLAEKEAAAMHRAALASGVPGLVLAIGEPGSRVPLLHQRQRIDGRPAAYVCRGFVCQRPVTDVADLLAMLP